MYHPNDHFWSSLGPKYELLSPKKITDFTSHHINMPQINDTTYFPEITRAIHYQTLPNVNFLELLKKKKIFLEK